MLTSLHFTHSKSSLGSSELLDGEEKRRVGEGSDFDGDSLLPLEKKREQRSASVQENAEMRDERRDEQWSQGPSSSFGNRRR